MGIKRRHMETNGGINSMTKKITTLPEAVTLSKGDQGALRSLHIVTQELQKQHEKTQQAYMAQHLAMETFARERVESAGGDFDSFIWTPDQNLTTLTPSPKDTKDG